MIGLAPKFFSLFVALAVLAAGTICPCLANPMDHQRMAKASTPPKCEKCEKNAQPSSPGSSQSCPECQISKSDRTAADRHDPGLLKATLAGLVPLMHLAPVAAPTCSQPTPIQFVNPPPLLMDLFHSSCLLTV